MTSNRRSFLARGAATVGAMAFTNPLAFLKNKLMANDLSELCGTRVPSPYGPLSPVRDLATGLELIMLPAGFQYTTFSWTGDVMSDGNTCPSGHDGMALVPDRSNLGPSAYTLIRNHEVFGTPNPPIAANHNYDTQGGGGTTAVVFRNGRVVDHRVSISGTIANCAGGRTPWGTWLTCEEGTDTGDKPHGYVFESTVARVTSPVPFTALGRMSHEACAFDPRTGILFLTEDNSSVIDSSEPRPRGNSGFYMFVPLRPLGGVGSLAAGGRLYMLSARDQATGAVVDDLRNPACFAEYNVVWIPIDEPDLPPVGNASAPYMEGRAKGGTRFQRLEGCWWDPVRRAVIFCDTEGGPIGAQAGRTDRAEGAIWAYDPVSARLVNLFVSKGALAPAAYGSDNPDNVSVSPRGGILLCEDGGSDDGNGLSLLGLYPALGRTFEFARNIIHIKETDAPALVAAGHNPEAIGVGDFSGMEWAGATFSEDGKFLFVNIQTPGITFAIWGPWSRGIF